MSEIKGDLDMGTKMMEIMNDLIKRIDKNIL